MLGPTRLAGIVDVPASTIHGLWCVMASTGSSGWTAPRPTTPPPTAKPNASTAPWSM